jgi:hypothetical protein
LLRVLDSVFREFADTEAIRVSSEAVERLENRLDEVFIFALVYSVGLQLSNERRGYFEK